MKVEIELPSRIAVDDYHEFRYFQDILRQFIPGVKVVEGGCYGGRYHGVIYVGNKLAPETKALFEQTNKEEKEFFLAAERHRRGYRFR